MAYKRRYAKKRVKKWRTRINGRIKGFYTKASAGRAKRATKSRGKVWRVG